LVCFLTIAVCAQHRDVHGGEVGNSINDKSLFVCGALGNQQAARNTSFNLVNQASLGLKQMRAVRKIRIAIVATGEYSQYFITKYNAQDLPESEQKEIVLQEIENSVRQVNTVFRRDLMVEFELIEQNSSLIFLDPETDGLNAASYTILLSQLPGKINSLVNETDYDIGHAFSASYGGLSFVGGAFGRNKAQGVTGAVVPEGKIFVVDFLAHELGHQLGATHTQNSECERCSQTSVEAGSGATIMGYAGICSAAESNVATSSLSYFHDYNILQINNHINRYLETESSGEAFGLGEITDYTIPLSTPFEVTLNYDLPENNEFVFSCSQIDREVVVFPPTSDLTDGPVFSAHELSENATFSFPKSNLVMDNNLNSRQGVLSRVPREYNFLASVRGGDESNTLVSCQKFKVNVVNAEPFRVTSQNEAELNWYRGSTKVITWDLGGSKSVLNHDFVQILLSTNNGDSFDYVLSENTPNDGSEVVEVPANINSNNCRIKVRPVGAIFYAVNRERFSISPLTEIDFVSSQNSVITSDDLFPIEVSEEIEYDFLEISVDLSHDDLSQMNISLVDPSGVEVLLWNGYCSNGSALDVCFSDVTMRDEEVVENDTSHRWVCDDVVMGLKLPQQRLTLFSERSNGTWNLKITGLEESQSVGELNSWGLHFFANEVNEVEQVNLAAVPGIGVYPNPVKDVMTIDIKNDRLSTGVLKVFSIAGELKKSISYNLVSNSDFYMGDLDPGMYLLQLLFSGGGVKTQKILVK